MQTVKAEDFRWSVDGQGEWLSIKYPSPRNLLDGLEAGKEYDVEIKPHKKKRSLDANAMYWSVAALLAQKLNIPVDEVYRHHIHDMSIYQQFCIEEKAVDAMARQWCSGHYGRMLEVKAPSRDHDGYVWVHAYYGSSDFDTAEMSRLIDNLLQDCKDQGVEVPPPQRIQSLLDEWDEARR